MKRPSIMTPHIRSSTASPQIHSSSRNRDPGRALPTSSSASYFRENESPFSRSFLLPVMPDSLDVILSLTQNHGFLRGGSQVGARDDSLFPSCRTPIRHLRSFERVRTRSRIGVLNLIISGQAPRDDRMGVPKSEIPYRFITG